MDPVAITNVRFISPVVWIQKNRRRKVRCLGGELRKEAKRLREIIIKSVNTTYERISPIDMMTRKDTLEERLTEALPKHSVSVRSSSDARGRGPRHLIHLMEHLSMGKTIKGEREHTLPLMLRITPPFRDRTRGELRITSSMIIEISYRLLDSLQEKCLYLLERHLRKPSRVEKLPLPSAMKMEIKTRLVKFNKRRTMETRKFNVMGGIWDDEYIIQM